jgi:molecular chaperone GrpE (heat shock protein)
MAQDDELAKLGELFARVNASEQIKLLQRGHRQSTENLLRGLLVVADALEELDQRMAEVAATSLAEPGAATLAAEVQRRTGIVLKLLSRSFDSQDLRRMTAVGQAFDVALHCATGVTAAGVGGHDMVEQENTAGYLWGEQVLRPASVVVGREETGMDPAASVIGNKN